jgi:hypothetical protein
MVLCEGRPCVFAYLSPPDAALADVAFDLRHVFVAAPILLPCTDMITTYQSCTPSTYTLQWVAGPMDWQCSRAHCPPPAFGALRPARAPTGRHRQHCFGARGCRCHSLRRLSFQTAGRRAARRQRVRRSSTTPFQIYGSVPCSHLAADGTPQPGQRQLPGGCLAAVHGAPAGPNRVQLCCWSSRQQWHQTCPAPPTLEPRRPSSLLRLVTAVHGRLGQPAGHCRVQLGGRCLHATSGSP